MKSTLEINNLKTHFFTREGVVRAVDDVSFRVEPGRTLAVVGESGCGKSVTALSIMRLVPFPPGRIVGGEILFNGENLLEFSKAEMRKVRGKELSMIFQEPMTSLNPVLTIGDQISETLMLHEKMGWRQAMLRCEELLELVNIPDAKKCLKEYPHRLSGGMRQRIMISMAVACNPSVLIADEPTTALDVTIQAQVLKLLDDLKQRLGMALILITHDLGVVAETADQVVVMYAGRKVEEGSVDEIFKTSLHPYTQGLMGATPRINSSANFRNSRLQEIPGMVPSLLDIPKGCAFSPRCPLSMDRCKEMSPQFSTISDGRGVSCFAVEKKRGE